MSYYQLCGALGLLKQNGASLDWVALNQQLREIAALATPISNLDMNTAAEPLHRKYRDMCLKLGLILIGELFNDADCVPLVEHGGSRPGAGRTAQTTDGGDLARKTVSVDATTVRLLTDYGDGGFSEGVRRAARAVSS